MFFMLGDDHLLLQFWYRCHIAYSRDGADNKKCIRMLHCVRKSCSHAAPRRIQTQLSSRCTVPQVMYSSNFHKHQKKISSLAYDIKKIDFWGIILEGF